METRAILDMEGDQLDDLLHAVETSFGIRFADEETARVQTAGDLHDMIMARLRGDGDRCATSMAFYRLRRGLIALGAAEKIVPGSPLPIEMKKVPKAYLRRLSALSSLDVRTGVIGWPGAIGMLMILGLVVLVLLALGQQSWPLLWVAVAMAVGATTLIVADRGRIPDGVASIGDLTRFAVARNHGRLVIEGAAARDGEVWSSVRGIVADVAEFLPESVGRDSRLFMPQSKSAACASASNALVAASTSS